MPIPIQIEESNRHGRLEPDQLAAFEKALGTALPLAFREHLIAHNGGCVAGAQEVSCGYGLHGGGMSLRLPREYGGLLPSHMLPVADTQGGDLYCISLAGADRGGVFIWDHEGGEGSKNFHLVAPDFDAFLRGLAISAALQRQRYEVVDAAVAELGINAPVLSGMTLLDLALRSEDVGHELIQRLVSAGAHIGLDALIEAVRVGRLETVQLLVRSGVDVNYALPDTGFTALMLAASRDLLDVAECLLAHGAAVDRKNVWMKTAADLARSERMRELLSAR